MNAAIISAVHRLLLRQAPLAEPDRLMQITTAPITAAVCLAVENSEHLDAIAAEVVGNHVDR